MIDIGALFGRIDPAPCKFALGLTKWAMFKTALIQDLQLNKTIFRIQCSKCVKHNPLIDLAGGPGFEPRLTESESVVLPLNYPPTEALMCIAMLVKTSRGRSLAKRGLFDKPQTECLQFYAFRQCHRA